MHASAFHYRNAAVTDVYLLVYTRTYARAGPYLIGIALGYLFHALKGKHIKIPMVSRQSDCMLLALYNSTVFLEEKCDELEM
jgi:hypothetical protein